MGKVQSSQSRQGREAVRDLREQVRRQVERPECLGEGYQADSRDCGQRIIGKTQMPQEPPLVCGHKS